MRNVFGDTMTFIRNISLMLCQERSPDLFCDSDKWKGIEWCLLFLSVIPQLGCPMWDVRRPNQGLHFMQFLYYSTDHLHSLLHEICVLTDPPVLFGQALPYALVVLF